MTNSSPTELNLARSGPAEGNDQLAVGIDFGGTKMLGVLSGPDGKVIASHRSPTPWNADQLIDGLVETINALAPGSPQDLAGVGIGAAGLVDNDGTLHFGPNLGGVTDVDIRRGLLARLPGVRISIDNDATCATWSECRAGAGKGVAEMALVTLGTGIGGGIVAGGRIWRGRHGYSGEFGHMTVVHQGVECVCGNRGCWEAYASGRALGRMGREAARRGADTLLSLVGGDTQQIRGEHVTRLAREGDQVALSVMDEFAKWVAVGVANVVAICDPEVVVVGGGMAEDADMFLGRTEEHLGEILFGRNNRPAVPVVRAALGERAGALGAVLLVFDELVELPTT